MQLSYFTWRNMEGQSRPHGGVDRGVVSTQVALDSHLMIRIASQRGHLFGSSNQESLSSTMLAQLLCHVMLLGLALHVVAACGKV